MRAATRVLIMALSAGIGFCAVDLFAARKHFQPDVPREHVLAHLDDHLQVLADESFTISDINKINELSFAHDLDAVVNTDFFSTFKADINSKCPYGEVYAQCALEGGCDITDGKQNLLQAASARRSLTRVSGSESVPDDWVDFDQSPFKPAPPKIAEAIGLLESYFEAKRINGALPALRQLRDLVHVGDGHEVDRTLVMQEHLKWLEDPAHDLWLVPDGLTAQYFDLRKNDERFTGYGVLALQKEAQAGAWGMAARCRRCCRNLTAACAVAPSARTCRTHTHLQFGSAFTAPRAT